jgi:hypothetical protein
VGDAKAGARTKRTSIRRRAVGTRDRIISHLAAVEEIIDPSGMASTRLAEAVGYPGSSVAFAQLLSGMERDGLIIREVRGKRTYRITLPGGVAAARAATARAGADQRGGHGAGGAGRAVALTDAGMPGAALAGTSPGGGFDYDELARRLLVQVLRRLTATSADITDLATIDVPGALAEPTPDDGNGGPRETTASLEKADLQEKAELQETVAGLERELATAWTRHGTLTAENAKLREQLREAQRDLALERTRRPAPVAGELNQSEVVLLERLLAQPQDESPRPGANAS